MSIANMSWSWKDDDGSGNIDQREFQSNLREYHPAPGQNDKNDFVVPNAGRNHYFFTPVYDPYTGAKSDNHYKALNKDWVEEDMREAGGKSSMISNTGLQQEVSKSPSRTSRSSGRRSSRASKRSGRMANAGRTPWEPKLLGEESLDDDPTKIVPSTMKLRTGHISNPRYRSHKELIAARAKDMRPDPSFDVDGDGVVSAQDFFLANQFDINGDKFLDEEERWELRKKMVDTVVAQYQKVPKGQDDPNKKLIRAFTDNVDESVKRADFPQRFTDLYNKTSVSMTWDSNRIRQGLQPSEDTPGIPRSVAGRKGGAAYRTNTARERSPHRIAPMGSNGAAVNTARSNDTVDLDRGPEWLQGGERLKWSGFSSRSDLMKSRKASYRAVADERVSTRMVDHIVERNKHGANLPIPKQWTKDLLSSKSLPNL